MSEQERLVADNEKWAGRLAFFWKALIIVGLVTILTTAGFMVYTLATVQRLSESNNSLNKQMLDVSTRIVDCTTPGYTCYDSGQAQTGRVVISLNAVTEAAAVCADQPGTITQPEMKSCIQAQLGKATP